MSVLFPVHTYLNWGMGNPKRISHIAMQLAMWFTHLGEQSQALKTYLSQIPISACRKETQIGSHNNDANVGVVVPLMLAVLPYARGRGFDSRSRLLLVNVPA
jgi:hypothetical protein